MVTGMFEEKGNDLIRKMKNVKDYAVNEFTETQNTEINKNDVMNEVKSIINHYDENNEFNDALARESVANHYKNNPVSRSEDLLKKAFVFYTTGQDVEDFREAYIDVITAIAKFKNFR